MIGVMFSAAAGVSELEVDIVDSYSHAYRQDIAILSWWSSVHLSQDIMHTHRFFIRIDFHECWIFSENRISNYPQL